MKIVNNSNALLVNKFSQHLMKSTDSNISSKNGSSHISSMLTEYEKTKNFNNQLIRNIGSPKGPVFARINL